MTAPDLSVPAPDRPPVHGSRPAGALGLRERKKRHTHLALREAAQQLVATHGFSEVTIDDIARAANLSTRTFFNHFDSKEAALVEPDPEAPAALAAALAARPATEPPLRALHAAVRQVGAAQAEQLHRLNQLITRYPEILPRYLASFTVFEQVIIEWAGRRSGADPRDSLHPAMFAAIATTSVRLATTHWRPEHGLSYFAELIDEFFALIGA